MSDDPNVLIQAHDNSVSRKALEAAADFLDAIDHRPEAGVVREMIWDYPDPFANRPSRRF